MKKCIVENCNNKYRAKEYCSYHFNQWYRFGYIPERTRRTPNEYRVENNICYISLYNKNCEKNGE